MGGDYLLDRRVTEVEIAGDATSVYAKAGKDRILYRVVSEYGGDTLTEKRTRSSRRPLSLGELTELFLGARPLQDVLVGNGLGRHGAQDFTRPSSAVYPRFEAGMRAGLGGWLPEEEEDG